MPFGSSDFTVLVEERIVVTGNPVVSSSFAVEADKAILVVNQVYDGVFGGPEIPTLTNSGTAITWTQQEETNFGSAFALSKGVWWTGRSSVDQTITLSFTTSTQQAEEYITVIQFDTVSATPMLQKAEDATGTGTGDVAASATLGSTPDSNNALVGIILKQGGDSYSTYTPGSGYTAIADHASVPSFPYNIRVFWDISAPADGIVDVSWTPGHRNLLFAFELDYEAPAVTVTGAIAATVQAATASLAGTQTQTGLISATAQAAVAALTGHMVPSGVIAGVLEDLTMSSTANVVSVVGTLAAELQRLAAESAGTQTQTGVVAAALQRVLAELAGAVVPDGDITASLLPPNAALAGLMPPDGEMFASLEELSAALVGSQELSGQLLATAVSLTMAAAGYMQPTGTLAGTLQALAADGVGEQVIVGVLGTALQSLTAAAAATQTQTGTMAGTLQLLTFAGIAALAVRLYGVPRDLLPPRSRLTQSPAKRVDPPSPHNELAKPASRLRPPRSRL